jgi:hypothetical protein
MTTAQKHNRYYEWVGQMTFLSQLIGEKFKTPKKSDGTDEDDIEVLWNWYQNYNNNLARELNQIREAIRNDS